MAVAKETDPVFTRLTLSPPVVQTELPVTVRWVVGADVKWSPTGNDEIRMFSTSGVLLSKRHLWDTTPLHPTEGYQEGVGELSAPRREGSYVVSLYDFASKRRVFSSTLRVAGSKVGISRELSVKQTFTPPFGRIDVAFNPETVFNGYIALYRAADDDNGGMYETNPSPFALSLVTVLSPAPPFLESMSSTSLAFVAPQQEGEYVVKYLKLGQTGILGTVTLSNPCRVSGSPPEESVHAQAIHGTLAVHGVSSAGIKVGEPFVIGWDITEGLPVLSPLDTILVFPFGRPETVRQTDAVGAVSTAGLAKWRVEVSAPLEAGQYEVGYYSFRLQKFVLNGPLVLVVEEQVEMVLNEDDLVSDVGTEVRVAWEIDEVVYDVEDRYRIYDDHMNLYGSLPITGFEGFRSPCDAEASDDNPTLAQAKEVLFKRRRHGTLRLIFDRPGKYIVLYWSRRLRREVAKTEPLRVRALGSYPVKEILVEITARLKQSPSKPVKVVYNVKSMPRDRTTHSDAIAIFPAGEMTQVPKNVFDSTDSLPVTCIFYLAGRTCGEVDFNIRLSPGEYQVRYLTPTGHGSMSAIFQCDFRAVTEEEEALGAGLVEEPLSQLPLRELCKVKRCIHADDGEGAYDGDDAVLVTSGGETGGLSGGVMKEIRKREVVLHVNEETSFRGTLMVPPVAKIKELVVVTFHITSGVPCGEDLILLVDELCTEVHSETYVADCVGRDDLTLGTALLQCPRGKGLYIACYYSSAHRSIVLRSQLLRVTDPTKTPDDEEAEAIVGSGRVVLGAPHQDVSRFFAACDLPSPARVTRPLASGSRFRAVLAAVSYHSGLYPQRGTSNDAATMSKLLLTHFPQADVSNILILDELAAASGEGLAPSTYNIRLALRWLSEGSRPTDHLLFYFAGLGSQINNYTGDEGEGYDYCLLPSDYDWQGRLVRYSDLRDQLYLAVPKGTGVTVMLDCCHVPNTFDAAIQLRVFGEEEALGKAVHPAAVRLRQQRAKQGWNERIVSRCLIPPPGSFHRFCGLQQFTRRSLEKETGPRHVTPGLGGLDGILQHVNAVGEQVPTTGTKMWLIQASQGDEMAIEKFLDGKYQGLFTWAFAGAVKSVLEGTSPANPLWYKVVVDEVQRMLRSWPSCQTPRLSVANPDDAALPLFFIPQ